MACVSVIMSYFLSLRYGLWGAALGYVVYDCIMICYVLPDSCRLLGMNVKDLHLFIKDDLKFLKEKIRK